MKKVIVLKIFVVPALGQISFYTQKPYKTSSNIDSMLSKQQKAVLKALVTQELDHVKDDKVSLVNSPVLSSISRLKETDIAMLKNKAEYLIFLEELKKKL